MILAWQIHRGVVWIKRLALAAESVADSQKKLLAIEQNKYPQRHAPKHVEIDVASVEDWNKRYEKEKEEEYGT